MFRKIVSIMAVALILIPMLATPINVKAQITPDVLVNKFIDALNAVKSSGIPDYMIYNLISYCYAMTYNPAIAIRTNFITKYPDEPVPVAVIAGFLDCIMQYVKSKIPEGYVETTGIAHEFEILVTYLKQYTVDMNWLKQQLSNAIDRFIDTFYDRFELEITVSELKSLSLSMLYSISKALSSCFSNLAQSFREITYAILRGLGSRFITIPIVIFIPPLFGLSFCLYRDIYSGRWFFGPCGSVTYRF